jgi:hypothetical protein
LGLPHDVVDPNQTEQQIDVVYPVLIELIAGDTAGSQADPIAC